MSNADDGKLFVVEFIVRRCVRQRDVFESPRRKMGDFRKIGGNFKIPQKSPLTLVISCGIAPLRSAMPQPTIYTNLQKRFYTTEKSGTATYIFIAEHTRRTLSLGLKYYNRLF